METLWISENLFIPQIFLFVSMKIDLNNAVAIVSAYIVAPVNIRLANE